MSHYENSCFLESGDFIWTEAVGNLLRNEYTHVEEGQPWLAETTLSVTSESICLLINALQGGAAFLGAGFMRGIPGAPSVNFMNSAWADLPRPDYIIRASSNENPYGPSQVALNAIAEALPDANNGAGGRQYEY